MNITVCDDEEGTRIQLRTYLERYEKEKDEKLNVQFFVSGEELLEKYPSEMDILLLDIRMYQISGMDIARHIRQFDDDLCIIFISNMTQYALEGYQVHAFNFLVKPFDYRVFEKELSLACRKIERRKSGSISVKNDSGVFQVCIRDIVYVETLDHKLLIHLKDKEVICYISMGQLEKRLTGKDFFRCHQSFLIHLPFVEELQKDSVRIAGGAEIPVSRHRRRELIQAMTKYAGEIL